MAPYDAAQVEVIYDVDLDEMIFRWVSHTTRTYRHYVNDQYGTLVDPATERSVGFVIERFSQAIIELPALRPALEHATRLDGDQVIPPGGQPAPRQRLIDRVRAMIGGIVPNFHRNDDMRGLVQTVEHAMGAC